MDEKWVDGIVTRTNIKILESYSIDRRHIYAHHKNYVDQVMFIVVNGFIPKENNLLGNGGRCIKVACVPVGDYEAAKRDSYSRVTDESGKFTYPKIAENIERRKGEKYWTNKTLCGIINVSNKQYSLIQAYNDHIILNMEEISRRESEG